MIDSKTKILTFVVLLIVTGLSWSQTSAEKDGDPKMAEVVKQYMRLKKAAKLSGVTGEKGDEFSVYKLDEKLLESPSMKAFIPEAAKCNRLYLVDVRLSPAHRGYTFCYSGRKPRYVGAYVQKADKWEAAAKSLDSSATPFQ